MALSYNGWPASPNPRTIGINTDWEPIPGHQFPGGAKSGDVQTVLTYVVRQLDARVEPIDRDAVKDEWGWYYKASANSPSTLSCHSSGTAFDYNATRHPNGHRGTFNRTQVAEIREILAEVGVVRWLGDAARTADEMHFEIRGTSSQVAAAAARIRSKSTTPTGSKEGLFMHLTETEEREILAAARREKPVVVRRTGSTGMDTVSVTFGSAFRLPLKTQHAADVWKYICGQKLASSVDPTFFDSLAVLDV